MQFGDIVVLSPKYMGTFKGYQGPLKILGSSRSQFLVTMDSNYSTEFHNGGRVSFWVNKDEIALINQPLTTDEVGFMSMIELQEFKPGDQVALRGSYQGPFRSYRGSAEIVKAEERLCQVALLDRIDRGEPTIIWVPPGQLELVKAKEVAPRPNKFEYLEQLKAKRSIEMKDLVPS